MHDVLLFMLLDEQVVEDFFVADAAVVRRLVLFPAMKSDGDAFGLDKSLRLHRGPQALLQHRLANPVEMGVAALDVARDVPGQEAHGHDGLEPLRLVPLVALQGQVHLPSGHRAHVPGDVVAPARRLDPVNTPDVDPDDVAGPLHESVARDAGFLEFFYFGPPGAVQVIDLVFGAEILQRSPIIIRDPEPFGISGADVDVDGAKVVVFLMPRRPGARHLKFSCIQQMFLFSGI